MNRRIGQLGIGIMVVILAGLAVHTPTTIWLGTFVSSGVDVMLKAWKEVLLLALIPVVQLILLRDRPLFEKLARDPLFWVIKGYVLLHVLLMVVLWLGWWQSIAGMMIDLRYILAFVLVYVLVAALPQARKWFLGAIAAGAVVIIGFASLQHVLPIDVLKHIGYGPDTVTPYLTVDRNYDFVRINSTMRGPNPLGAYAASVVLIIVALIATRELRGKKQLTGAGVMSTASLLALWSSYSRSAKLALAAGLVMIAWVTKPWQYLSRKVLVGASVAGVVGLVVAAVTIPQTTFFSNVFLHTNPEGGSSTQSNEEHRRSLQLGIERMIDQPIGAGIGSTGSASLFGDNPVIIENQFLFIAHELGWLGLVLFVVLLGMILWRLYVQATRSDGLALGVFASGVGLVVVGLVLPVYVDDVVSIIWWSLAAIVLGGTVETSAKKAPRKSKSQETSKRA